MHKRILVVDDSPEILKVLSIKLQRAKFMVMTAMTGRMALQRARADRPHLIVLDITLPELSGLEVCQELKREEATAGIPIIMLSAKRTEIDRILGLEFGADDYMVKPFSPQELVLRIRSILGMRPGGDARRRLREQPSKKLVAGS
jgi:DNA-binding response OmpR family regulator